MTEVINYSQYEYIVLIDESGDPAFDKMSNGKGIGSDFLNLGAVFIARKDCKDIKNKLNYIRSTLSVKSLHFTDLRSHYKKLFAIKTLKNSNFVAFSVISNKKTLKEGMSVVYNPKSPTKFYHKNLCYLFERFDQYIKDNKLPKDNILFIIEKNNAVNVDQFGRFINRIKTDKPWKFTNINTNNIIDLEKDKSDLLFLADIVAGAIHNITFGQYFDGKQIIEPRYLLELIDKFYTRNNIIIDNGLKFVHKLENVQLSSEALDLFSNIN